MYGVHDHTNERRQFGGCLLACGVLASFTSCAKTATACQCSILKAAGPVKIDICAGCMALFFPAAGADLILAAGYCNGVVPGRGVLAQCSSQCDPLLRGYGGCQNINCLCPTVSSNGEQCSSCLAAINTEDAAVVGSLITQCGIGVGVSSPQTMVTPSTFVITAAPGSAMSTLTAATSTAATVASRSSAEVGSINGIVFNFFNLAVLFALIVGIVGIIL